RLGYRPHLATRELQGEAREVARDLVVRARRLDPPACLIPGGATPGRGGGARGVARAWGGRAVGLAPPACLIAGGETTVTVTGKGRGGRCQEFALAAALELVPADPMEVLRRGHHGS